MNVDYMMLISDSLMSGLATFLTFRIYFLLNTLRLSQTTYTFGSTAWWHWMEHLIAASFGFIGAIGMSIVKIMLTIDQHVYQSSGECLQLSSNCSNPYELAMNAFQSVVIVAAIILINHMIKEETPGSEFEHFPREAIEPITDQSVKGAGWYTSTVAYDKKVLKQINDES